MCDKIKHECCHICKDGKNWAGDNSKKLDGKNCKDRKDSKVEKWRGK